MYSASHRTNLFLCKKAQSVDWAKVPLTQSIDWAQLFAGDCTHTLKPGLNWNMVSVFLKHSEQPDCSRENSISPESPFVLTKPVFLWLEVVRLPWRNEGLIFTTCTGLTLPGYTLFYPGKWSGVMLFIWHLGPRKSPTAELRLRCPLNGLRKLRANTFNSKTLELQNDKS